MKRRFLSGLMSAVMMLLILFTGAGAESDGEILTGLLEAGERLMFAVFHHLMVKAFNMLYLVAVNIVFVIVVYAEHWGVEGYVEVGIIGSQIGA